MPGQPATALPAPEPALGQRLADAEYLRERTAPGLRDENYLSFKDLFRAVAAFARQTNGRVFDYGCGGAPYRDQFGHCEAYVKADVTPGPHVDRVLSPDGETGEPDGHYDAVFSAQVLEHVKAPAAYVRECHRMLKPGGKLFISTHGFFLEHGCPHDYQRWTPAGLEALVAAAGFRVIESAKLTAGPRGMVQLQHHFVTLLRFPDRPWLHYPCAVLRKLYRLLAVPVLNWGADRFPELGVAPGGHPAAMYVGVCVTAEKTT